MKNAAKGIRLLIVPWRWWAESVTLLMRWGRNSSIYKYIGANSTVRGMLVKSEAGCKTRRAFRLTKVLPQSVKFGRGGCPQYRISRAASDEVQAKSRIEWVCLIRT
jgi:hypothetical protein